MLLYRLLGTFKSTTQYKFTHGLTFKAGSPLQHKLGIMLQAKIDSVIFNLGARTHDIHLQCTKYCNNEIYVRHNGAFVKASYTTICGHNVAFLTLNRLSHALPDLLDSPAFCCGTAARSRLQPDRCQAQGATRTVSELTQLEDGATTKY